MRKLRRDFFKIITSKKGRICAPFFFERVIQNFIGHLYNVVILWCFMLFLFVSFDWAEVIKLFGCE